MTEVEDSNVRLKRHQAFLMTDLGRLYGAYEKALTDYWRNDDDETISDMRLMELDKKSREATHAFLTKLMELAGV